MDDPWGEEQGHRLGQALVRAGITMESMWLYYLHLGGTAHRLEIDAYLHRCLRLPRAQRDLLAKAANTLITCTPPLQAPYSHQFHEGHGLTGHEGHELTGHEPT